MKTLIKPGLALLILVLGAILLLSLWASMQIGKAQPIRASAALQQSAKIADHKPTFQFRGLRIGTGLKEAQTSGIVTECDKVTDYVGCRLKKNEIGDVAIWESYIDFTDGKLDTFMVDINSDWFDQLASNLRSAYGQPCGSDTHKLQNAYGATFDGDELWWCFADGNLVLRRHNKEDFRKAGLAFERTDAPKPPATFTSDTL